MKNEIQVLHDEAGKLLQELTFIPETGAMCRGDQLRVWFQFRRFGRSRSGEIGIRTAPPLPDLHIRLTQPCTDGGGENIREAFTDASGSAVLEYVLGDVPCAAAAILNEMAERPLTGGSAAEEEEEPLVLTGAPFSLAAKSAARAADAAANVFEPRSWEFQNPAVKIAIADFGFGDLALAVETEDAALNGRTLRIHLGASSIEMTIEPLTEFRGVFGGTAPLALKAEETVQLAAPRVEIV